MLALAFILFYFSCLSVKDLRFEFCQSEDSLVYEALCILILYVSSQPLYCIYNKYIDVIKKTFGFKFMTDNW